MFAIYMWLQEIQTASKHNDLDDILFVYCSVGYTKSRIRFVKGRCILPQQQDVL